MCRKTSGTFITGTYCCGGNHFRALYFDSEQLIVGKI